jgi:ABC-type branched-subunit amino acid transport system ATPase component
MGTGSMPLLATEALTVRFGGVTAVDSLSVAVEPESLTGIIGPNGAGKTTYIDAVSGLVRSSGQITFEGRSIAKWRPHQRAKAGLGRTFQGLELFDEFTIEENLLIPAEASRRWQVLTDLFIPRTDRVGRDAVSDALERVGIARLASSYPSQLSLGERKLVSIARALSGGARMVMLDEPAAGLNSEESLRLGETLRELVRSHLTVLLVDHDMGLVLSVCDSIHVLDFGKLIASGPPEEIRRDERVIEAYLGEHDKAEAMSEAEAL